VFCAVFFVHLYVDFRVLVVLKYVLVALYIRNESMVVMVNTDMIVKCALERRSQVGILPELVGVVLTVDDNQQQEQQRSVADYLTNHRLHLLMSASLQCHRPHHHRCHQVR